MDEWYFYSSSFFLFFRVLSKSKLFYGWMILLFFILFLILFFKWKLFMCYLYYGILNISDRSWCVPSSVRIFFLKLDLAHKWINCCYKSISVCVFTAGIVCIIYFNCSVVYLALLSMFLFQQQCLVMPSKPIKFETQNKLRNAAICSNPSFVVPGDPEVVSFVLM